MGTLNLWGRRNVKKPEQENLTLTGWLAPKPIGTEGDDSFVGNNKLDRQTERNDVETEEELKEFDNRGEVTNKELRDSKEDISVATSTSTPSSVQQEETETECIFKRGGYCRTHQKTDRKTYIVTKKWKDRGGGRGFGYANNKVVKYICQASVMTHTPISGSNINILGGSVSMNIARGKSLNNTHRGDLQLFESESYQEIAINGIK